MQEVTEGERAVACEKCDDWYHTSRMDVSQALYKGLYSPYVLWICSKFLDKVKKTLSKTRDVQSSVISDTDIKPINEINTTIYKNNDIQLQLM